MAVARPMAAGSTSTSDQWRTPKWLCDLLGQFDVDVCGSPRSHVTSWLAFRLEDGVDGLKKKWDGQVFCNPPYSNVMPWAERLAAHDDGWCALVKLDPTTKWWATLMSANPQVAMFRKRIKFEGDRDMTANFPSALIYRAWSPSRELEQHLWIARWA